MRTVRFSGRRRRGVSAQEGVCLGEGLSAWGVSAQCGCLPQGLSAEVAIHPPDPEADIHLDRVGVHSLDPEADVPFLWTDRHMWKHSGNESNINTWNN